MREREKLRSNSEDIDSREVSCNQINTNWRHVYICCLVDIFTNTLKRGGLSINPSNEDMMQIQGQGGIDVIYC